MPAMILNPFIGDNGGCWSNRSSNEIIFTAARSDLGATFNAIEPGAMQVRLSAPAARLLAVTGVIRDGEVFHAQLARFDDEPPVRTGLYLTSVLVVASIPFGETFQGTAIASVRIDEDLPAIPRPVIDRVLPAKGA